jgi:hypothetical protein
MNSETGKYLMIIGIGLAVAGIVIYFFHDKLHWMGRLPGDIRIEKENFRFYFPVTTLFLLCIALMIIIRVIKKL